MGIRLKKGQIAMEFVMLIMLAFMIMVVFTVIARDQMSDLRIEDEYLSLKDVAAYVRLEINTAENVEDGYKREFIIPSKLDGINYTISISNGFIMAESVNHEIVLKISPVTGNLAKGQNTITKKQGVVYLNQ